MFQHQFTKDQRRELFTAWQTAYTEAATFLSLVTGGRIRTSGGLKYRANIRDWAGQRDKRLLIEINEMTGLGDVIQYIRFIPALAEYQTEPVTVACQKSLTPLLSRCIGSVRFIGEDSLEMSSIDEFEVRTDLYAMSLHFHPWKGDIIPNEPYISADPVRVARFLRQVPADQFKVGIVWAAQYSSDNYKSFPLGYFAPLADIPGVQLVSLQKGAPEVDLNSATFPILRPLNGAPDAEETAALMKCCDLIVSVDSFPCHLAGAMGLPVFTVLSELPCTRWQNTHPSRAFTSWYPTMKLYHQRNVGEWPDINGLPAFSGKGRKAVAIAGREDLQQRLIRDVTALAQSVQNN